MNQETLLGWRAWGVLNVALLLALLLYGGFWAGFFVLLGTDHSRTPLDELGARWALGAALGLLTALLASRWERRYLPWTAALMLTGTCAMTFDRELDAALPLLLVTPLVPVSVVLHAFAGRGRPRVPHRRRQVVVGVLVTLVVGSLVGAVGTWLAVMSRSTPLYDTMRAEPMAADRLAGLEVESDHSRDESRPGFSWGAPPPAEVTRLWRTSDGSSATDDEARLADLAQHHGWVRGPEARCAWRKSVDGYRLCLELDGGPESDEIWVKIFEDPASAERRLSEQP